MCGCLSCTPCWGPGPQPRHVPQLGFEPEIFGSQACTQSTELHQPGLSQDFLESHPEITFIIKDYTSPPLSAVPLSVVSVACVNCGLKILNGKF